MKRKPRFGGAFFTDAHALYAFKGRGFGGEIGLVTVRRPQAYLRHPLTDFLVLRFNRLPLTNLGA